MKRKLFYILICTIVLFGVCGCKNISNKQESKKTEKVSMTEEEKIWDDAAADEIYKQRIFLYDQYSEFNGGNDFDFKKDVELLNSIKDKNKFANKFIELLNKTNIIDVLDNGTKMEQYILFSYLSLMINRCEGLCAHDEKTNGILGYIDEYKIGKVYYKDTSFDSDLNPRFDNKSFSWPCFIFEFQNEKNDYKYVIISSFDDLSSNTFMEKYFKHINYKF